MRCPASELYCENNNLKYSVLIKSRLSHIFFPVMQLKCVKAFCLREVHEKGNLWWKTNFLKSGDCFADRLEQTT